MQPTAENFPNWDHISDETLQKDIDDTVAEIELLTKALPLMRYREQTHQEIVRRSNFVHQLETLQRFRHQRKLLEYAQWRSIDEKN